MNEDFFKTYSPSVLYTAIGCGTEYVGYEDQNLTRLDIPFLIPSEEIFKFSAFIDMCRKHHASDSGAASDYEEVSVGGLLKARGGFYSGRPYGCWRFFHENGKCSEFVHLDVEDKIIGEHVLF
ncbi:MAG: hypothetical protein HQL19_08180 [Candidatus Omnitrophica bacterium]|nr:hypothetical protein [Candidatus Omnitrophota bacterium]